MDIKDKIILITGGTRGIGLGIARELLKNGAKVAVTGTTAEKVEEIVRMLGDEAPGRILGLVCDVTQREQCEETARMCEEHFGAIHAVVANAGVGYFAPIDQLTPSQWHQTIDVNLTGVFNMVQATVDALKKTEGYLITIASLAGTNFFAGGAAYNASKFGLVGFTQAVMLDLRPYKIKVTTIMPGSVATEFGNHQPGPADSWKIQPEDIGQMVCDLLRMPVRTLPSKIEVRPAQTGK